MKKKYIDADRLIAELKRQKHELELSIQSQGDYGQSSIIIAYENIISRITVLQQEQSDKYEIALEKAREWMPNVNQGGHAILISIFPELGEGLDPRYGGRKHEQQEVDLEKEVQRWKNEHGIVGMDDLWLNFAHYFYELSRVDKLFE